MEKTLQLAINDMDKCFDLETAISCQSLISTIISNCNSHPNELLTCNDARIAQYPSILKNAKEEQIRAQQEAYEAQNKTFETKIQDIKKKYYTKAPNAMGGLIIDMCIKNDLRLSQYYAKSVFCDGELRSLQKDCQTNSSHYYYCKDQRLVGYLAQYNSTVIPYSNLTGKSSSSNSTYP